MSTPRAITGWLLPAGLLVVLLLLFRETATAMVAIWIRSETYQHAFLVIPITAWLIWRRREALSQLPHQPQPWLLGPLAALCLLWMLGDLAEVAAAAQFALVGLVVLGVPALYGWRMARAAAFPLLFLFFLVPFGEFAIPFLQEWTANITVWGLQQTGIPVYREGMQFVIPTGTWSVVAACSGLSYTIALLMVGTLFAYFNFQSLSARLLFIATAFGISIIANWVRAYTIVMIGHLTGSPLILGVEHTVYGWFLFGFIVLIFFVIAGRWAAAAAGGVAGLPQNTTDATRGRADGRFNGGVAIGLLGLLLLTQAWSWKLQDRGEEARPALEMPANVGAWQADDSRTPLAWQVGFVNPTAAFTRSYANEQAVVQVWVGYYRHQSLGRKLATSSHRVVSSDDQSWRSLDTGVRAATQDVPAVRTSVASAGVAPGLVPTDRRRVWYAYWFDGRWLVRPAEVKFRQALERLLGRDDDGAVVMLVTDMKDDSDAVLERFTRVALPAIGEQLQRTRNARDPDTL